MNRLLNPEALREWKASPLTQDFLAYLRDRQMDLMQAWGRGVLWNPEQQAQAVLLDQLADLSSEMIAQQYPTDDRPAEETTDAE